LVQGRCDVLAGQARRSGGAISYAGYAEFEAAVDLLVADPEMAPTLGARGRAYVERRYSWDAVLGRYERLLGETAARWAARAPGGLHGPHEDRVPEKRASGD
jgi:glycosyltransferase involved in cell wall biosynthesis